MPLSGIEQHVGRIAGQHQRPGLACIFTSPDAPICTAHRGVDDHLAVRRQLGINDDLVHGHSNEFTVAAGRIDGQIIAA